MTARIDIKKHYGKSLEGFPHVFNIEPMSLFTSEGIDLPDLVDSLINEGIALRIEKPQLHKGDTITIDIV